MTPTFDSILDNTVGFFPFEISLTEYWGSNLPIFLKENQNTFF